MFFVLLLYWYLNPEDSALFPKCPFYLLTGLECPSCGIQRALHSLLNGDIMKAIEYNQFLLIALPFLGGVIYTKWFETNSSRILGKYILHRYTIYVYVCVYVSWWIIRNI